MDLGFLRRLERNRVKVTPVTPVTSGLGPFLSVLPQEILHELFDYLPLGDVGNLALASRYSNTLSRLVILDIFCKNSIG